MAGLIDDLLLLARLDEERPLTRTRKTWRWSLMKRPTMRGRATRGANITVDAGSPVVVVGDEPRLRQIVANLLENAQVHTPSRCRSGSRLALRDQNWPSGGDRPPGPVLDPDQASHVFERFYRGTAPGSDGCGAPHPGSGLGLAIVQNTFTRNFSVFFFYYHTCKSLNLYSQDALYDRLLYALYLGSGTVSSGHGRRSRFEIHADPLFGYAADKRSRSWS